METRSFNYNLFQSELELIGKNCTEEKDLIKNWFESRFLNTNGVRHAKYLLSKHQPNVEDTIQNGAASFDRSDTPLNTLVSINRRLFLSFDVKHISIYAVPRRIELRFPG